MEVFSASLPSAHPQQALEVVHEGRVAVPEAHEQALLDDAELPRAVRQVRPEPRGRGELKVPSWVDTYRRISQSEPITKPTSVPGLLSGTKGLST